jgi:hypothetical protein
MGNVKRAMRKYELALTQDVLKPIGGKMFKWTVAADIIFFDVSEIKSVLSARPRKVSGCFVSKALRNVLKKLTGFYKKILCRKTLVRL